ncbi:MAG: hypothetical protein AAF367_14460 [Pseudomonadota bacterium]
MNEMIFELHNHHTHMTANFVVATAKFDRSPMRERARPDGQYAKANLHCADGKACGGIAGERGELESAESEAVQRDRMAMERRVHHGG